jgi:hypothetical protein
MAMPQPKELNEQADLTAKRCMSSRSLTNDEKPPFVMPAWIAGIQIRKDACRDIHVDLDSSPPCWNDGIEVLYWT